MSIKKIWGSRSLLANANTYIGESGSMFYDETDGELRLSDGATPGGLPITIRANVITSASLLPNQDNDPLYGLGDETHRWHHVHLGDGGTYYDGFSTAQTVPYLPGALNYNLVPVSTAANLSLGNSTSRWGDIWVGKASIHMLDETLGTDVALTVDNATMYLNGVQSLTVGNLTIVDTTLTSKTPNLNINIGDANDTGTFYVKRKAQFDNTTFSSTEAMVSFNASGGADPATIFPDTVLQTVSRPNKNSRIIQRAYGSSGTVGGDNSYAVWGSYAARGNTATPAPLKANDILLRLSANGYGDTTWGSGGARVEFVALENFSDTAKGTKINFWTTPAGQLTSQNVASINSVGLVTAGVEFSTDSTVQTTAGIPLTQRGAGNGVATLGVDGRLTSAQIPTSLLGGVQYVGSWTPATNTPALSNGTGTNGQEYSIAATGYANLGVATGNIQYIAGGYVIYGGNVWNYTPAASNFTALYPSTHLSVNSPTGNILISTDATPTSVAGTIVSRDGSGNFGANTITATLVGAATSAGTAGTVTSGVQTAITQVGTLTSLTVSGNLSVTSPSYIIANGALLTALPGYAYSNVNVKAYTEAMGHTNYSNVNVIAYLAGNISTGNIAVSPAGTITTPRVVINDGGLRIINGGIWANVSVASDSMVLAYHPSGAGAVPFTVNLSNYTAGATVRVQIRLDNTSRDINYGVSTGENSSTAATSYNGNGIGSTDISNSTIQLLYTCYDGTAANTYVAVTTL